jgi:hypothetical protein
MFQLPAPPTNVAVRSVWEALCLAAAAGVAAIAFSTGTPLLAGVGVLACAAIFVTGLRHERLPRRAYAAAARVSALASRLMTMAVLRVLHGLVLPALRGTVPDVRFVGSATPGASSSWCAVEHQARDAGAMEPSGSGLSGLARYRRTWALRREHAWLLPLYPYLRLLDCYKGAASESQAVVPTKTYTLF